MNVTPSDAKSDRTLFGGVTEMQTTIPTPLSSPRKILSSDKKTSQELTDIVSNPTTTTSKHLQVKKRISSKYSHLPGALRRMCRRQANTIIEDRDAFRSEVPAFVSQEFNAHALAIIEGLFKNYVQSNVVHVHPITTTSTETESSATLQYQLYMKMNRSLQDRADDISLWEALRRKLVPSCYVIFDLEPLSLSFDFVFMSEIFKSLSFSLDRLCRLAILCLEQHAHTLHHLESLIIIFLDRLDILKEDLVYQSLRKSLSLILELS
ncbi:hypothetical protein Tco_0489319 [Tanacetum coccineum]